VERQVMRLIDANYEVDSKLLVVNRHHESRPMYPPEVRGYRDLSQEPGTLMPADHATGGRVLALRETRGLLAQARHRRRAGGHKMSEDAGWLKQPDLRMAAKKPTPVEETPSDDTDSEISEGPATHRQTYIGALYDDWSDILKSSRANVWDFDHANRLPPMSRTASLPLMNPMNSRFGELYEQRVADPFEDCRKLKPEFVRFAQVTDNSTLRSLLQKPGPSKVSVRQTRVNPKPICSSGANCLCGGNHSSTSRM